MITRYEDARTILTSLNFSADRSAFFVSQMANVDLSLMKDWFPIIQRMMVTSDGKEHEIRRQSASMGISDRWVDSFKSTTRKIVKSLLGMRI